MGFKHLAPVNFALLTKQDWRLIKKPESLWERFLKSLYQPDEEFLQIKRKM